jgi:hypothetical protein
MHSKKLYEGVLTIDHRGTQGVADSVMAMHGLPAGSGTGIFECAAYTCSHCQRGVTVAFTGKSRVRETAWCKKCDHYLCDDCGAELHRTGVCYPYRAMIDDLANKVEQTGQAVSPNDLIRPTSIIVP